jgi:hypothetical protein
MAVYWIKLKKTSTPKFMHNAQKSGAFPKWTYTFWRDGAPNNTGEFDIDMTRGMKDFSENDQSKQMNDAAKSLVKKNCNDATEVKLTSV